MPAAAADLSVSGGFNVNSTSIDAWIAVLSSLKNAAIPIYGPVTPNMDPANIKYTKQQQKDAVGQSLWRRTMTRIGWIDDSAISAGFFIPPKGGGKIRYYPEKQIVDS